MSYVAQTQNGVLVHTEKDMHVEHVHRDKHEKLKKLQELYFKALVSELACPRYNS